MPRADAAQRLEERTEGTDDDRRLVGPDAGDVEGVGILDDAIAPGPATLGRQMGQRVQRRDAERAAQPRMRQRLLRQPQRPHAPQLAGKRHRHGRRGAAHRLGDVFQRRGAQPGMAAVQRDGDEEQPQRGTADGPRLGLGAEYSGHGIAGPSKIRCAFADVLWAGDAHTLPPRMVRICPSSSSVPKKVLQKSRTVAINSASGKRP